jgi:hypothetical protein
LQEAAVDARRDLIASALTETARGRGSGKGRIKVDPETAQSWQLSKLQPIARSKADSQETVVLRIKAAEWIRAALGGPGCWTGWPGKG